MSEEKIQCVGFARNWLRARHGLSFADVRIAADIWDGIHVYTRVCDGRHLPASSVLNGSHRPPANGDLLVYGEKFRMTGHVAVVETVDLRRGVVSVSEKNYAGQERSADRSRHLPLIRHSDGYWLLDTYLIGWKSLLESV